MGKRLFGLVSSVIVGLILLHPLNLQAQTWNADLVIGQTNFTSSGSNNLDNNDLQYPYSSSVIVAGKLIVADSSNNRVLIYNSIPTTNGASASVVVGQPNFNTNTSGVSATKLNNPVGVHSDGTRLFIADYNNNRVLIYNSIPTTNGAAASVVIGQTSFTVGTSGTSQTKLYNPTGVYSDGTKLYIADYNNHRVLIYNSIPTTNGAAASVVVGQTDFITRTYATSQTKFYYPFSVSVSGTKLFVADRNNHRVLIYNSIPTANGAAASVVVGQPDFITGTYGTTQSKMYYPTGVYANGTKLYVADNYNHRVLIYNSIPTANGALASVVVGQTSFTIRTSGTSSTKLYYPSGVCTNGTKLFIADRYNHRALIYNSIPTTSGAAASVVVGHSTFTNGTANDVDSIGIWNTGRSCIAAGKLFVVDQGNNRVLIFNSIPTTNGASANLVIGQTDLTSNSAGTSQTKLRSPSAVFSDGTKVYIADRGNNRVLIYNSIPTANGAAASVVVGQPDFVTSSSGLSQTKMYYPYDIYVSNGKLFVADTYNHRVLVYNSIPTANGATASVVVGQTDFITRTSGLSQTKFNYPWGVHANGTKLFVADRNNNRVLIYNSIPTANGAAANLVIGQTNFTTGTAGTSSTKLYNPNRIFIPNGKNKIYISDSYNHRIIIYDSIPTTNGAAANKVVGQDTFTTRTSGVSASKFNYPNFAFINGTKLWVSDYNNSRIVAGAIPNNPPVLNLIGNKTGNEGALLQFTISATDPDNDTLTYSASNLPSGATFDPATRTFSWTPTYTQAGTYPNVHFEVSDGLVTDSEDITITINDVGNFIKIQNGYFFNPLKNDYWLPHGIAYQTWNRPLGMWQTTDQLDYDLDEMVKAHVNSIRVDFVWKHIEEQGDNIFNWTNYDYLVQAAAKRGIKIFALVGYQWPPDWFPKTTADDPDAGWYTMHPAGYDNEGVYQPNRWRSDIMSYEDTNARAQYKEFLAAVAARYKNNPTIVAWIVGNEYGYLGLWSGKQDGYDKDSETAFRNWLSTYYGGNISNLNSVWGTSYTSFSQVVMPSPYNRDNPAWWDLVQWREDSVAKFTAEGAKAVRDADLNHLISYATVGMQWGEEDWRYHAEDTGKIAKACKDIGAPLSFWSINNYPWGLLGHESQTGQWGITNAKWRTGLPVLYTETGFTSSETMYPGLNENNQGRLIRNSLWEALETGAIGVHIFTWNDRTYITDREKGFGLVYADRRIKPAFWVVRDTYNLMDQVDATHLFANSTDPAPDVAFYWSDATDGMYNRYECNMQQIYGALERLGLEPTFINRDQLLTGEYTKYKAIILPRNMRMYPGDLNFIRTTVIPAGVNVYADADLPGMQDYHVKPLSDFVTEMDSIFGVNASNTSGYDDPVENEKYGIDWTTINVTVTQNLDPLRQGRSDSFRVWKYSNMITATTGTVYATHSNNNPALVIKNNGTAKAAITTFSLGDRNPDSDFDGQPDVTPWSQRYDWLKAIFLNSFGINPVIKVDGSKYVLVDYRTCADGSILISAKNYRNDSIQTVNIETDLIAGKTIKSLTSGGILQENSGGMVSIALEADGHELLHAFGTGTPPVPGNETSENNMWKQGVARASSFASGPSTFPLTSKWNQNIGSSVGSPVVTDTTLYISSYNEVRALNPATGALVWKFSIDETSANFEGLMAVANDMLFVGTRNPAGGQYPRGTLYCLDAVSGKLKWKRATANWIASAPVVSGGVVYYGGSDAYVYAVVAKTGRLKWSYYGGSSLAGLAVYNGAVYFGTTSDMWSVGPGGVVYALNTADGSLKWKNAIANYIDSTPAVANGKVYISVDQWYNDTDGLYCFDANTGTLLWKSTIGGSYSHSSPAVANGIAYIGGSDNRLYAFDANTGALKWSYLNGNSVYNCAPVVANGIVYFSADKFYALNATTGSLLWSYAQSGWRSPYPKNGWIYFVNNYTLYAFSDGTAWTGSPPPTPPAPSSQNASVYILDAPATVHPMGDKSYQVKIRYDTRASNLDLKIAFQEDGDNGDGIANEIYQLYTYPITGKSDVSYWFWIPEPNLGDTDYKSTIDGGKYVFHAWLEESGTKIAEAYHSTILEWGANPTTPVPTSLQKGQTYTLNFEWEELPEYLWWENTPLDRETTYPQRIAVARSSKTQAQYSTHYDKVNQACDWLESLGYSHSNPAHTHFDDVSVTNGATTLFFDNFNDGNADGWTQVDGCSRWKVDSLEYSVDRLSQANNIQVAGDSTWTTYTYEAKVKYVTLDPYFKETGLVFRYQNPDNYYTYKIYDFYGFWRLIFSGRVGGVGFSQRIADISKLNENTLYTLKVVASGSNFTFYLNGTQQGSPITDTRLASGKIGLFARASQLGVYEPTKGYYFVDDTERGEDIPPSNKLIWSVSYDPTDGGIRALAVYSNKLYAGTNRNIYVYDGSTWSLSYDTAESQVYGLGVYNNKLYAAIDNRIYVYDGTSWQLSYTHPSSGYFFSFEVYNSKLYAGADSGAIYVYNGTSWSLAYQYPSDSSMVQCMKVYNNKLYTGSFSRIYVYDGSSWSLSGTLSETYQFRTMGVYNNKLYAAGDGSSAKAKIHAFDGTSWSTVFATTHDSVRSFEAFNNKLYYGTADYSGSPPSKGEIYFYDGTNWDWDYDTKDMGVYSLAAYNNKLYASTDWNCRIFAGAVDYGTLGELLNFNWGYLKEFFQAIVLPSVYVMNNDECYNLKFYLQEGLFTAIATDGGVGIKKPDGSSGVGRIESVFGVGTSYSTLSSLQNLEVTDNTHYITHDYNNGQLIATNPSAQATAWTVTTTGRKVADIKNAASSAPALISNTVVKGDIYFQNFEPENSTQGAYYYDANQSSPSFSTTTVHGGTKSLKIVTGTTYGTVGINAATPSGYFDLTKMTKLYMWVYDTQGNNYPMLKLKDVWGNVSAAYVNSYQPAVKNQWTLVRWDKYPYWTDVDMTRIASIQIVEYNQGTYYFDDIYYETSDFGENKSKAFVFNFGVDTYNQLTDALKLKLISQRAFEWGTREIYKMKVQLKYPTENPADGDLVIAEKEVWIIDGSGTISVQVAVPSVTMTGSNLYWVAYVYPWDSSDPWRDHMGFYTSANDPGYQVAIAGYGLMITGVTDYGHGGRPYDLWAAYNTRGDTLKLNYGLKEKGDNGDGKPDEVYYSPFYDGKTDPNYWLYEYTNTWEFRGNDTAERPALYMVFKEISSATTPKITFDFFNLGNTPLTLQKSSNRQTWTTIYTSPATQGPYNPTVNLDTAAMYYRFVLSGGTSDLIILRKNMTLTGYPNASKFRMEDWRQTVTVNGVDDDITYWPWVHDYDTGFGDYIGTLSGGNYEWKAWYTETSDAYYKPMKVYWGPRFKVEDVNFPTKIVPGTTVNVPIKWENLTTAPAKLYISLQRVYPGRYASTGGVVASQTYDLSVASGENTFAITVPVGTAASINYMWVAYAYPPTAYSPYNERIGLDDTWRYNPAGQPYEEEQRTYVGQKFTLTAPTNLQKNVRANFTLNFSWQNLPAGYVYTVWYNLVDDNTDYGYNGAYDNGAGHEFWGETFTIDNTTGANSTGTKNVVKDLTIYNYNRFIWKTTLDSSQYSGYEGEDAVKAAGY